MKNLKSLFIALLMLTPIIFMSSCATILSGTTDKVTFNSTPAGADVLLDGQKIGTTNSDITVKRKYTFKQRYVTYQLEGYNDERFPYEVKTTPTYWLNIFLGVAPCVVDMATGACMQSKHESYTKTLTPKK